MDRELEDMIDKHGLQKVLRAVANVCWEKAEHVEATWNDRELARLWLRAGNLVDKTAAKPAVTGLP